jgi:hypothetical protein
MGLFGSDTKVITETTSNATDRRTLAEAGGLAAQSVGGDLVFQQTADGAIEGIVRTAEGALDLAALASGQVAQTAGEAIAQVAASRGSQPINPVFIILAIGGALWLATRGKGLLA